MRHWINMYLLLIGILQLNHVRNKWWFVFEHCRHGARSWTNVNKDSEDILGFKWKGKAEWTNIGIRQQYWLGIRNRNKYNEWFDYSKEINPKEIEIFSTISNRTIMSAQAQMWGMFNGNERNTELTSNQILNALPPHKSDDSRIEEIIKNLGKSPLPNKITISLPVHLVDIQDNVFQFEKKKRCKKIDQARKRNKEKQVIQDLMNEFKSKYSKQVLDFLRIDNPEYFDSIGNVEDFLNTILYNVVEGNSLKTLEEQTNITMTEWYEFARNFSFAVITEVKTNDEKDEIAYASGSVLLRKVVEYMENIINSNNNDAKKVNPKFVLFSAHDGTWSTFLNWWVIMFNIKVVFPEFASNLFIELYREDNTAEHNVHIVFNDEELKVLNYKEFKKVVLSNAWTLEKTGYYCGFIWKYIEYWNILAITFGALTALVAIIHFVYRFKKLKTWKRKKDKVTTNLNLGLQESESEYESDANN